MSTNIQIDVVLQRLQEQARQVLGQNRSERQEREDAQLEGQRNRSTRESPQTLGAASATGSQQTPAGELRQRSADEHSAVPDTYKKRRPAANRNQNGLTAFSISWKGEFSGGLSANPLITLLGSYEVFGSGIRYDTLATRYSGLRHLAPSPIRFAAATRLVSVIEEERNQAWASAVSTCRTTASTTTDGFTDGDSCSYSLTEQFQNYYPTAAKNTITAGVPYVEFATPPSVSGAVGPVSYTPATTLLTVDQAGTIFLTVRLPNAPQVLTPYDRVDFENAGYPINSIIHNSRVDFDYSYAYDPWPGLASFMYVKEVKRYLFMRVTAKKVDSKIVQMPDGAELADFYAANLYAEDPSTAVRAIGYFGEYRVSGSTARFVRLKSDTGDYSSFPYNFLQAFTVDTPVPVLDDGYVFEELSYSLTPWTTASQLKSQLDALSASNPATSPNRKRKLSVTSNQFIRAKQALGTDPGEELTPYLYFVA